MAGIYILYYYAKKHVHTGLLWSGALILAGAIGNVIDSMLYGVLLDNAPYNAPTPWFYGQVIDMFYFPLFEFNWPQWVPYIGGDNFLFFSAIFNVADASIFTGVMIILLYQKRFFLDKDQESPPSEDVDEKTTVVEGTDQSSM